MEYLKVVSCTIVELLVRNWTNYLFGKYVPPRFFVIQVRQAGFDQDIDLRETKAV